MSIPNGPSALAVKEAAWGLARYAAICQVSCRLSVIGSFNDFSSLFAYVDANPLVDAVLQLDRCGQLSGRFTIRVSTHVKASQPIDANHKIESMCTFVVRLSVFRCMG